MATATRRITYVWLLTSALTIASWAVAVTWGGKNTSQSVVETLVVLGLAAVKARFILRDFMEVRSAPSWLRVGTDGWIVVLWGVALAIYLV